MRFPLLESGLKIAPQRADLHAALGESYFMSGKAERAIEEFKTLIDARSVGAVLRFHGTCHTGIWDVSMRR